jgi:hypothetical protein
MTIHDITALSFFGMAQAVTFAAGVLVGSLSRKDASNDDDSDPKKNPDWWHTVGGERPRLWTPRSGGGCPNPKPEADSRQCADR